jgi:hypothetical protein
VLHEVPAHYKLDAENAMPTSLHVVPFILINKVPMNQLMAVNQYIRAGGNANIVYACPEA